MIDGPIPATILDVHNGSLNLKPSAASSATKCLPEKPPQDLRGTPHKVVVEQRGRLTANFTNRQPKGRRLDQRARAPARPHTSFEQPCQVKVAYKRRRKQSLYSIQKLKI